jgi:glutamate synthase domain-containing protein 3
MNDGRIIINGDAGDALGYAMRGGKIYVKGNSGYRTGIHMKQYKEKRPAIIVGGRVGSFLGEYLAGGLIIVLGMGQDGLPVGNFTATGMHGGEIFIRSDTAPKGLGEQITVSTAETGDLENIKPILAEYAQTFGYGLGEIFGKTFYKLVPNAKNPYNRLYTHN